MLRRTSESTLKATDGSSSDLLPVENVNGCELMDLQTHSLQPAAQSGQVSSIEIAQGEIDQVESSDASKVQHRIGQHNEESHQRNGSVFHDVGSYRMPTDNAVLFPTTPTEHPYMQEHSKDNEFFDLLSSATSHMDLVLTDSSSQLNYWHTSQPNRSWGTLESAGPEMTIEGRGPSSLSSSVNQSIDASHRPVIYISERARESVLPLLDDDIYARLQEEVHSSSSAGCNLPSATKLQQFIKCYADCFHNHFPILHLPTFATDTLYSPLLLAVSSIGALYRLKSTIAKELWMCAQTLLESVSFY